MADEDDSLSVGDHVAIFISAAVWIVLCWAWGMYTTGGSIFFGLFARNPLSIIGTLVLMTLIAATTMYYIEWFAIPVCGVLFIIAFLSVGFFLGKEQVSKTTAATLIILMLILILPLGLSMWKRRGMNYTERVVTAVFVLGFWVLSILVTLFLPYFRDEVQPDGKTRTMLILLFLTFYCLLYALQQYAPIVISGIAVLVTIVWMLRVDDVILSVSLATYQKGTAEMSMGVGLMLFAAVLNFVLMVSKDQSKQPNSLFVMNTLLFVIVIIFILGVLLAEAIRRVGQDKVKSMLRRGVANLDFLAWPKTTEARQALADSNARLARATGTEAKNAPPVKVSSAPFRATDIERRAPPVAIAEYHGTAPQAARQ